MTIEARIRKIRDVRGWKQTAVAHGMEVTQQSYSCLEQKADKARLETLSRFCNVVGVSLHFLLSDVPVTEETVAKYGSVSYNELLTSHSHLEKKVEIFEELLTAKQ